MRHRGRSRLGPPGGFSVHAAIRGEPKRISLGPEASAPRPRRDSICLRRRRPGLHRRSLARCLGSRTIEADLGQLARLALFNRAINNTDDHSRNFSLIHRGDGFRLSPAYDLVPNLTVGEYHVAGFGYGTRPPSPSEALRLGKVFGLSKPWMRTCAEEVLNALDGWSGFAEKAGVDESESVRIGERLNP